MPSLTRCERIPMHLRSSLLGFFRSGILPALALLIMAAIPTAAEDSSLPPRSASASPTLAPMSDFQKGIAFTAWFNGAYSSARADKTLTEILKPLGVNWIEIVPHGKQNDITSTVITTDTATYSPTDDDLRHVIRRAHDLGIRVLLKPHVDLANDPKHWRGQITAGGDEASRRAWFESYASFILHYARLAQETAADSFSIGTELSGTSRHSEDWRRIAAAVRKAYKGPLIYAANWGEEGRIDWWDCVDSIGVDAYYPLLVGNEPTVEQLKTAWAPVVSRLAALSARWNRPVVFTEIGYRSMDGAHRTPGTWDTTGPVSLETQAACYEAVFQSFAGQPWFKGIFWWDVNAAIFPEDPNNTDYTPIGKPAEDVLRKHYGAVPR